MQVMLEMFLPIVYIGRKNDSREIWTVLRNTLSHPAAMPK